VLDLGVAAEGREGAVVNATMRQLFGILLMSVGGMSVLVAVQAVFPDDISSTTLVENPDVLWAGRQVTEGATPAERNSRVAFVAAVLHERHNHRRQQHHQEERTPMTDTALHACRQGGRGVERYCPVRSVARPMNLKKDQDRITALGMIQP
jgi:hypothetical protein